MVACYSVCPQWTMICWMVNIVFDLPELSQGIASTRLSFVNWGDWIGQHLTVSIFSVSPAHYLLKSSFCTNLDLTVGKD